MEIAFILVVLVVFFILPVAVLLFTVAGLIYSIFRALGGGKEGAVGPEVQNPPVARDQA
jgi:hypothetical protein